MGPYQERLSFLLCLFALRMSMSQALCDISCGAGKSIVCYDLFIYSWTACDYDKHNLLRFNVPFTCGCCEKDDADGDGICDVEDECEGFDDRVDNDSNGFPDGCEPSGRPSSSPTSKPSMQPSELPSSRPTNRPSLVPTPLPSLQPSNVPSTSPTVQASMYPTCGDADSDGVCDDDDICPSGDDTIDTDGDGVPDACDTATQVAHVDGFLDLECPPNTNPVQSFGPNCELNQITYELWMTPPSLLGFPVRSGCHKDPVAVGDLAGCSFCDDDDTQNTERTLVWFLQLGTSGCTGTVVTSALTKKLYDFVLNHDGIDLCSLDYSLGYDGPEYVTNTLPKRFKEFLLSEMCVENPNLTQA